MTPGSGFFFGAAGAGPIEISGSGVKLCAPAPWAAPSSAAKDAPPRRREEPRLLRANIVIAVSLSPPPADAPLARRSIRDVTQLRK
ncbi:hypothetical protein MSC49_07440 [Methylosinus sp. C49]|nr:hypothetical protein MSC49_07440 [Methylosinus sp. C49]